MVRARVIAALALCAADGRLARAASCSDAEGSSISAAYGAFQQSVAADCADDQCVQPCVDTLRLLSTALPDCEYVDGANYRQQVLVRIASCDENSGGDLWTPEEPTNVPAVATEAPAEAPMETTAAPAAATGSSGAATSTCSPEQEESILATYSAFQSNVSAACASDKCASACVAVQTDMSALLPDCQYADGTNYHQQATAVLSACGVNPDDAGFLLSASPCSETQANVTVLLYNEFDSGLRDACDADKCSADCISVVHELAAVLPDCVYADGINYRNESIGLIAGCANITSVSSGSSNTSFGPDSAARTVSVSAPLSVLLGILAVLAAHL